MPKTDLISLMLGKDAGREKLASDMKSVYKQTYQNTYYRYAALRAKQKAIEEIQEQQKPGMFQRGAQRIMDNPIKYNANVVDVMYAKKQATRAAIARANQLPSIPMRNYKGKLL